MKAKLTRSSSPLTKNRVALAGRLAGIRDRRSRGIGAIPWTRGNGLRLRVLCHSKAEKMFAFMTIVIKLYEGSILETPSDFVVEKWVCIASRFQEMYMARPLHSFSQVQEKSHDEYCTSCAVRLKMSGIFWMGYITLGMFLSAHPTLFLFLWREAPSHPAAQSSDGLDKFPNSAPQKADLIDWFGLVCTHFMRKSVNYIPTQAFASGKATSTPAHLEIHWVFFSTGAAKIRPTQSFCPYNHD